MKIRGLSKRYVFLVNIYLNIALLKCFCTGKFSWYFKKACLMISFPVILEWLMVRREKEGLDDLIRIRIMPI